MVHRAWYDDNNRNNVIVVLIVVLVHGGIINSSGKYYIVLAIGGYGRVNLVVLLRLLLTVKPTLICIIIDRTMLYKK